MKTPGLSLMELKARGQATISVEEAAGLLGISLGSARKAVRNGELPSLRLGSRYLILVPRLLSLLGVEDERHE